MSEPTAEELRTAAKVARTHGSPAGRALAIEWEREAARDAAAAADREVEELARVIEQAMWNTPPDIEPRATGLRAARAARAHLIPDGARVIGPEAADHIRAALILASRDSLSSYSAGNALKWFDGERPMHQLADWEEAILAQPATTRVPRTWDNLADVPHDVIVSDADFLTAKWNHVAEVWQDALTGRAITQVDSCGDWSEVLL